MKKTIHQFILTACCSLLPFFGFSQNHSATISGHVVDEDENPIANVSVFILGKTSGTTTNDSGYFKITAKANKAFALIFSLREEM